MILIFGGTTEGRAAVRVLDGAGQPYFYSTRGQSQQVESKHGVRLSGGMNVAEIKVFCRDHDIRLIIDAAHPFAEQLHRNIAEVAEELSLPVIRYERLYPVRNPDFIWCSTFNEALDYLDRHHISDLLALTGVQTIDRLRPYWEKHACWFRILNREESLPLAQRSGFPVNRLLFFSDGEDDLSLIRRINPGAVLTKESGFSGFFLEKVDAAAALHIPVIVIKRPLVPGNFYIVTGEHGLRFRTERLVPGFFPLTTGYTTGSCACAAAKAALQVLLTGGEQQECGITLPSGEEIVLKLASTTRSGNTVTCSVIKDAGDDPDVTNGCKIQVTVQLQEHQEIRFLPGEGVGVVTLPGIGLEIGEPAVNPTPRKMIRAEIEKLLTRHRITQGVDVTISVENGAELALKTFNPKLGIVGGISIIGTSGIVRPFSTEAFIQTIRKEIQVARALGCEQIIINSGAKSERVLRQRYGDLPPQAFVHYGNFIGETLKIAVEENMKKVTMGIMIGKAVKLAEGNLDTHSRNVVMNRDFIVSLALESGCLPESLDAIQRMTMARELWTILPADSPFFSLLVRKCHACCAVLLEATEMEIVLIPE